MLIYYLVVVPMYLRRIPVLQGTWMLVVAEAVLIDLPIYLWLLGHLMGGAEVIKAVFPKI